MTRCQESPLFKENEPVITLKTDPDLCLELNAKFMDSTDTLDPIEFDEICDQMLEDSNSSDEEQETRDKPLLMNQQDTKESKCRIQPGPLYFVNLVIGEMAAPQKFLLDTGSSVSVIKLRDLPTYFHNNSWKYIDKQIFKRKIEITTAAGATYLIGELTLPVYIHERTYHLKFHVMDNEHTPSILGSDLLYFLNCQINMKTGYCTLDDIPVRTFKQQVEDLILDDHLELSPKQITIAYCKVKNMYTEDNLFTPTSEFESNALPQLLYCEDEKIPIEVYNDTNHVKMVDKGTKIGSIEPFYSVNNDIYPLIRPTQQDLDYIDSLTCNSEEECHKSPFHRHSEFQTPPYPKLSDIHQERWNESRINEYLQEKLANQHEILRPPYLKVKTPSVARLVAEMTEQQWLEYITQNINWQDSVLTESQKKEIIELLMKYRNVVFHPACGIPCFKSWLIKPEYYENEEQEMRRKRIKSYRLPCDLQPRCAAHIRSLLQYSVLQRAVPIPDSMAPCLVIFDPQLRKSRLCIDLREQNSIIKLPKVHMKTISECLAKLQRPLLTSIDLSWSFYSMVNHRDFQDKSVFQVSGSGCYKQTRASMGSKLSPLALHIILEEVFSSFQELQEVLSVYVDDISWSSDMFEEAKDVLEKVLKLLYANGFVINLRKCRWMVHTLQVLGWQISHQARSMLPHHVKTISQLEPPENFQQLMSKRSLFCYFRELVPNFSLLSSPLYEINSQEQYRKMWSERHLKSFRVLKYLLSTSPALQQIQSGQPIFCFTDASGSKVSLFCCQKNPKTGLLHPVVFYSASLSKSQRKYSTWKKELLALYKGIKLLSPIFRTHECLFFTDHQPLLTIYHFLSYQPDDTSYRMINFISGHNLHMHYIKGQRNIIADVLSRSSIHPDHDVHIERVNLYLEYIKELKLRDGENIPDSKKVSGRKSRSYEVTVEDDTENIIKQSPSLQQDFQELIKPIAEQYQLNFLKSDVLNKLSTQNKSVNEILENIHKRVKQKSVTFNDQTTTHEVYPEYYYYNVTDPKFADLKNKTSEATILQSTEQIDPKINLIQFQDPTNIFSDVLITFNKREYKKYTQMPFFQSTEYGTLYTTKENCNSKFIKLYNAAQHPSDLADIFFKTFTVMQKLKQKVCTFTPIFLAQHSPADSVRYTFSTLKSALNKYKKWVGDAYCSVREINLLLSRRFERNDLMCKTMRKTFSCIDTVPIPAKQVLFNMTEKQALRRSARIAAKQQHQKAVENYLNTYPDMNSIDALTFKSILEDPKNKSEDLDSLVSNEADVANMSDFEEPENLQIDEPQDQNEVFEDPISVDIVDFNEISPQEQFVQETDFHPLCEKNEKDIQIFQKPFAPGISPALKANIIQQVTGQYHEKITKKELQTEQSKDTLYGMLIRYLKFNTVPNNNKKRRQLINMSEQFCLIDGLLYRFKFVPTKKVAFVEKTNSVCLCNPECYQLYILERHHDLSLAKVTTHSTAIIMYTEIGNLYWFPQMMDKIKTFIRGCRTCLQASLAKNTAYYEPGTISHQNYGPMKCIGTDIAVMPKSKKGSACFIVFVDNYSSYVHAKPLRNMSSTAVWAAIENLLSFAHIARLHSDRGGCYVSSFLKTKLQQEGITQTFSTTNLKTGNSQSERSIRLIKYVLKLAQQSHDDSLRWDERLRDACFAINSVPHVEYKISRHDLLYNCQETLKQDKLFPSTALRNTDIHTSVEDILAKNSYLADIRQKLMNDIRSGKIQDLAFQLSSKHQFHEGEQVALQVVSHYRSSLSSKKLVFTYVPWFKIFKLVGLNHVILQNTRTGKIQADLYHVSKLRITPLEIIRQQASKDAEQKKPRSTGTQTDVQQVDAVSNQLNYMQEFHQVPFPPDRTCSLDQQRGLQHTICVLDVESAVKFHIIEKNRLQMKTQTCIHFGTKDMEAFLFPIISKDSTDIQVMKLSDDPIRLQRLVQVNVQNDLSKTTAKKILQNILHVLEQLGTSSVCMPCFIPGFSLLDSVSLYMKSIQRFLHHTIRDSELLEVYITCPDANLANEVKSFLSHLDGQLLSCTEEKSQIIQVPEVETLMSTVNDPDLQKQSLFPGTSRGIDEDRLNFILKVPPKGGSGQKNKHKKQVSKKAQKLSKRLLKSQTHAQFDIVQNSQRSNVRHPHQTSETGGSTSRQNSLFAGEQRFTNHDPQK